MTKEQILDYLRNNKTDLMEKYGVIKIGLFGSYAREEQKENSDIDLIIELDKTKKDLKNFFSLKRKLENDLKIKVDIGLENAIKPKIRDRILKETIYV